MPATTAHPAETKEQAKALYVQGIPPARVSMLTGVKLGTISQWIKRGEWGELRDGITQHLVVSGRKTVLRESSRMADASQALREKMADILQAQTEALSKIKVRSNIACIREVAETLEPLSRTAKLVHDWGSDRPIGIVLAGELAAVNVQSTISSVPEVTPISNCSQDVVSQPSLIEDNRSCEPITQPVSVAPSDLPAPVPAMPASDDAPGSEACLPGSDAPDAHGEPLSPPGHSARDVLQ